MERTAKASGARCCKNVAKRENLLLMFTVFGVFGGIILGVGLKFGIEDVPTFTPRQLMYLQFPGILFQRMLKCMILPLITSSLISSIASLDMKTAGRVGGLAALYYLITTLLAVITGIILVVSIRPGSYAEQLKDTLHDDNRGCQAERAILQEAPYQISRSGMNIIGLITFSILFGFIINGMGVDGLPLGHFFIALECAMMRIITLIIWLSPVGILFLIAGQIVAMDNLVEELKRLGMYIVTVLVGLGVHGLVTLPLFLFFLGGRNPLKYAYNMLQAYLTALGTSSSSATMPITYKCLEEHNGIDKRVTRFMIPLGAAVNMDGTALYEAVAAIYIAQTIGRSLNFGEIIMVSLTATFASIGGAGIPGAGLITMLMVLIAVGLPPQYYSLIVPVDWFLDRIRTMINVHGDSVGTAIVQRFCQAQLKKLDHQHSEDIEPARVHMHTNEDKSTTTYITVNSLWEQKDRWRPQANINLVEDKMGAEKDEEKGEIYIIASWKRCLAVIMQLLAILFNGSAMAASHWTRVGHFRTGIFEKCTYRLNATVEDIVLTLPDAPPPGECAYSITKGYIQLAASLQVIGCICSLIGAVANVMGLKSISASQKFICYRIAMYLALLGVLFQLGSLISFPISFNNEVKSLDKEEYAWARDWSFSWCYIVAWGAAICTFGAAQLIFWDRNFDEIQYKPMKTEIDEEKD